ncbi:MAG: DHA2 family efflux MFS transporter permease subunit [Gammaproteobacteria bacterium]|nr:DHA2 family efflux MFS transporter permease subunit [Gammaproteobacteria bacterium]
MHRSDRSNAAPPPIPARIWKIAAVTGAGAFMAMLDSTVANLALESVRADFGATLPLVQWIVSAYLIALAVSLPAAGWLGSRYGYGRVFAAALAGFVATSALCGVAPGPLTLIASRVAQGLAAGLMVPAGQAVLGSTAAPNQLGRLMGTLGLVVALGPAIGPVIGGFVLEIASWRWLFWINVPVGAAALVAARNVLPRGTPNAARALDVAGLALLAIGLPLLLFGAAEIGSDGASIAPLLAVGIGGALIAGFVSRSRGLRHPLIDLRLLRGRIFGAATVTTGLTGANMYGGLLLLPLYLQLAADRSLGETGAMLLAMGLGSAAVLPAAGALTDRYGAGRVALVGAALLIATLLPFLAATAPSTAALAALLAARGAGLALAQMPAMTAAYASAGAERMGDAATLVNIVQRVGSALGAVALAVAVAHAADGAGSRVAGSRVAGSDGPAGTAGAYTIAFAVLTAISVLTLLPAAALRRQTSAVA